MNDLKDINLQTLAKGALAELFAAEFEKVVENIVDVNTPWKTPRKITIDLVFRPEDDRKSAEITMTVVAKVTPVKSVKSRVFVGKQGGRLVAAEYNPLQLSFFDEKTEANVVPMAAKEEPA